MDAGSTERRYTETVSAPLTVPGNSRCSDSKMWTYCESYSRSIEIVYKSDSDQDILTRMYYPVPSTVRTNTYNIFTIIWQYKSCMLICCIVQIHLSSSEKEKLVHGLDQEKAEEKLTDLLHWIKSIRRYHCWKVCMCLCI